jgi:hypothetical protein
VTDSKRTATLDYDITAAAPGALPVTANRHSFHPHEKHTRENMADLSVENAHPGSTTASALNSRDTSRAVTPAAAAAERPPEEGSKFKTLLSILRKCVILP